MKRNRNLLMNGLILLVMAVFTFSSATAQEKKEEKKVIKIKMMTDENGETTIDTTIVFDENFEGDWKALIEDEEILEKLEEIEINVDVDEDGKIYIMSSGKPGHKEGDSTMTFIIKIDDEGDGEEKDVMVWYSDGDGKHKHHKKGHKMVVTKTMDVHLEEIEGDTVITYTIEMEGEGDGKSKNVMVWSSGDKKSETHEIIELKGHDGAMIFKSTIMVTDISEEEKEMLENAGLKMDNDPLNLSDLQIWIESGDGNIKIDFTAHKLKNVQISLIDEKAKQLFLEELKLIDGKYIREIEIPNDKGNYFLHIKAGKESMTMKISLQ